MVGGNSASTIISYRSTLAHTLGLKALPHSVILPKPFYISEHRCWLLGKSLLYPTEFKARYLVIYLSYWRRFICDYGRAPNDQLN